MIWCLPDVDDVLDFVLDKIRFFSILSISARVPFISFSFILTDSSVKDGGIAVVIFCVVAVAGVKVVIFFPTT